MSGIVGSNLNIKGSGLVAKLGTDGQVLTSAGAGVAAAFEDVAGGLTWQSVVTGSTLSAVAGNGYWIDTTSNACTITLPASATNGDEIILNWSDGDTQDRIKRKSDIVKVLSETATASEVTYLKYNAARLIVFTRSNFSSFSLWPFRI